MGDWCLDCDWTLMERLPAANTRVGGGLNYDAYRVLLVPIFDQCGALGIAWQLKDLPNVGA